MSHHNDLPAADRIMQYQVTQQHDTLCGSHRQQANAYVQQRGSVEYEFDVWADDGGQMEDAEERALL